MGSDADLATSSISTPSGPCGHSEDLKECPIFRHSKGKRLRGWPAATIKAGQIVARDGEIAASRRAISPRNKGVLTLMARTLTARHSGSRANGVRPLPA